MTARSASRLRMLWAGVRDSLWFIPAIAVLIAIAGAVLAVEIPSPAVATRAARLWLFGGSAEGARGVLSAIAGSLITVTGVVFSVTIVALQLASSQFTPRVLRSFVADRVNQTVLGVFIGTFTYTLLVLRTIRSQASDGDAFVPDVAVLLSLVLLLVSIGALILFINHSARSVQAGVVLAREARRTVEQIRALYPERAPLAASYPAAVAFPDEPAHVVTATTAEYLQAVDVDRLWRLAERRSLAIRLVLRVGDFGTPGKPLASVWPAAAVDAEIVASIRDACVFGEDRTPEQDVEFGIIEISDIAVRALSPGVNDPTTAMRCIDRLTQILAELGQRVHGDLQRVSSDGRARLLIPGTTFERALGLAFDQIRHSGAGNPAILKKLLGSAAELARLVAPIHFATLLTHVAGVASSTRGRFSDPSDLASVESLAAEVRSILSG